MREDKPWFRIAGAEIKVIATAIGEVAPRGAHCAYRHIERLAEFFKAAIGLLDKKRTVAREKLIRMLAEYYLFRIALGIAKSTDEDIEAAIMVYIEKGCCKSGGGLV